MKYLTLLLALLCACSTTSRLTDSQTLYTGVRHIEITPRLPDYVDAAHRSGSPAGTVVRQAEVRAELAAAEIELYRHTGERDKLTAALESRVEARKNKLQAVTAGYEVGTASRGELCDAENQLLDAMLEQKRVQVASMRPWGPEQATGKPDAYLLPRGGDYQNAWASLTPDGQPEWLELTWKTPVESIGVDIYETFNPGALTRISTFDTDRKETTLWEGTDPTSPDAKYGKGISQIRFEKPVMLSTVRFYVDSPAVPGWNEIDAVGLVEVSGAVRWATGASASSTFAEQPAGSRQFHFYNR